MVGVGEAGEIGPCAASKPRDISNISVHHVSTRTTVARERRYTLVLCLALLTWLPSIGQTNEVLSAKMIPSRGPDLGVYLLDAGLLLSSLEFFMSPTCLAPPSSSFAGVQCSASVLSRLSSNRIVPSSELCDITVLEDRA